MPGTKGRRRWPLAEKRRIVELTLQKGASIRAIALQEGVQRTSLCNWRALYHAGELVPHTSRRRSGALAASAAFMPVAITPDAMPTARSWAPAAASALQITLPSGAMLRIEAAALDLDVLCALIAQLQR
jgi:transposase-like protein